MLEPARTSPPVKRSELRTLVECISLRGLNGILRFPFCPVHHREVLALGVPVSGIYKLITVTAHISCYVTKVDVVLTNFEGRDGNLLRTGFLRILALGHSWWFSTSACESVIHSRY